MQTQERQSGTSGAIRLRICWALFVVWLIPYLISLVWPNPILGASTLALIVLIFVQGSVLYGWKGILAYLALGIAIGFSLEASSVATGFPFGSYTHNVAGPKPLGVPPSAFLAYAGVGWFAWVIGRALVLDRPERAGGLARSAAPVIAAFVIAGFDLPYDPIGATISGNWSYAHPSGLYGVPLSNLMGWLFTGWVLFQVISLIERHFVRTDAASERSFWAIAPLIWIAMSAQFVASWLRAGTETATAGTRTFFVSDIYEGAVMTSLFAMVLPALLALLRLYGRRSNGET